MSDALKEYYEALDRIAKGKPKVVSKGVKITNDAVALEAGRNKGSIKKSRPVFSDLIDAIKQARDEQQKPIIDEKEKLRKAKEKGTNYRLLWEEALVREISLVHEIHELKQEISSLKQGNVLLMNGKVKH